MKRTNGTELNRKELRVVKVTPADVPHTIAQMARKAWPGKGWTTKTQGNWQLRNCLRKLVKTGRAKKIGRGLYVLVSR